MLSCWCDFGGDGVDDDSVVAASDAFFEFEDAFLDVLLVGDVVSFSLGSEVSVGAEPLEESVLSYLVSVLCEYFGEFSDEAALLASDDGVGEGDEWCVLLSTVLELLDDFVAVFNLLLCDEDGFCEYLFVGLVAVGGDVASCVSYGLQDFLDSFLELLGDGLPALH